MTASPEMFARVAFRPSGGAWVNAKGLLSPVVVVPGRERIKRDDALNSFGDVYADVDGRQTYNAQLSYYLTANSYADLKSLFTGALGAENAATTLTFSSSATNLGVNISGGGPAAIIKATGNDGLTYFVAADTNAANLVTYFPSLPTGVTTTACANLSANSGGVFDFDGEGEAVDEFDIESDWAAKPSATEQDVILATGAPITSAKLNYEKDKLLSYTFGFGMAKSYTERAGAAVNITDPGAWTVPFLGWAGDWFLSAPSQGTASGYLINNGGGYAAAATTVVVDTGTGTLLVGDTVTFAGVTGEYVVTAALASNSFSFLPGLAGAVADNAAITVVGKPTWASAKTGIKKLDLEMAKEVLTETKPVGLDGGSSATSTLQGNDISGYTANGGYKGDVTVLIPWDVKWPTRFKAKTPTRLFGVMYPGTPKGQAMPNNRAILYIRRLIPVGRPVVVNDGGVKCMQLTFMIERDLTANGVPERLHFGLSN
jgi:hypothetical protein